MNAKKNLFGSKSKTKPGTLLKSQIPIKTFSDWNEDKAGFVEIDSDNGGEFINHHLYEY